MPTLSEELNFAPLLKKFAIGGDVAYRYFAPGASERLESYLLEAVVGQDLAIRQLADAVRDHLATPVPKKPLIVSAHGPPGVGKTLTHRLLAQVLYSDQP